MAIKLPGKKNDILEQIGSEYQPAYDYMAPKRRAGLDRLPLYSNQRRAKDLVGDTTLFTVFNTVIAKLYSDTLSVDFKPGHPDDDTKVSSLSPVQRYDYYQMRLDKIDYDWVWLTGFWGAGFLDLTEWDSKKSIINPSVIDNATFLLDPYCSEINGDARGFGAARFWGREIVKSKDDMKSEGTYFNFKDLQVKRSYSQLSNANDMARAAALNYGAKDTYRAAKPNEAIPLLEWFTIINNEKWLITTDEPRTEIVRAQALNQDKWSLAHRKMFPIPGDPFGVSIPDLIEDKQRAKSVLTNLGLMTAKSDLYPMYVYDRNVISPTTDLSFGFNKWIPSDGAVNTAVAPLPKAVPGQMVSYIMDMIDQSAQKATAATSMQQGVQSEKPRSANEMVRVFNQSDERLSLGAKIFGWSERDRWQIWLDTYKKYFAPGGKAQKKFIRIDGAFGSKFQTYTGEDFRFTEDPDIYIESKALSDAQSQEEVSGLTAFANLTAQDQSLNRRYFNKDLARKVAGKTREEIDRMYPPTIDEMKAQDENVRLQDNKMVKIDINDDHQTHLQIHAAAGDSKAAIVHIEAHKRAAMIQRQINQQQQTTPPNPTNDALSTQQAQNLPGTGSAPAASATPANTVQQ